MNKFENTGVFFKRPKIVDKLFNLLENQALNKKSELNKLKRILDRNFDSGEEVELLVYGFDNAKKIKDRLNKKFDNVEVLYLSQSNDDLSENIKSILEKLSYQQKKNIKILKIRKIIY